MLKNHLLVVPKSMAKLPARYNFILLARLLLRFETHNINFLISILFIVLKDKGIAINDTLGMEQDIKDMITYQTDCFSNFLDVEGIVLFFGKIKT